jgi:acetylornithine deacetylase/succinyl-diaminopimelate desuccinylase-like protein
MTPGAEVVGDLVLGLGAGNPKGHAACVIAAAEAIARAGVPQAGDLLVGLGAGGMPTNARPGSSRRNTGQGAGCSFLIEQGWWADFAMIAKPTTGVSTEEVGLAWFDITVHGTHTYVGSRHKLTYRSAIADAGDVVRRLEDWFPQYAARHTDGLVEPQGVVAAIEGGWMRMAAVTPAACRLRVDLRLSPRTTPAAARRELATKLDEIRDQLPGVQLDLDMVLAIPGTTTDPDAFVCRSAVRAWEAQTGQAHQPVTGMSGATDANILRSRGIPTARVGMPKVAEAPIPVDFALGMNATDVREMETLTHLLIRVAVDTVTRTTEEVGL